MNQGKDKKLKPQSLSLVPKIREVWSRLNILQINFGSTIKNQILEGTGGPPKPGRN